MYGIDQSLCNEELLSLNRQVALIRFRSVKSIEGVKVYA